MQEDRAAVRAPDAEPTEGRDAALTQLRPLPVSNVGRARGGRRIARLGAWCERRSQVWIALAALLLIALVALVDHVTGPELAFSLFYLIPVSLAAWMGRRPLTVLVPFAAGAAWMLVEHLAGRTYPSAWYGPWNGGIRVGFFLITALLIERLRDAHQHARVLARMDQLTGLLNARSFSEALLAEASKARISARPFTLVYLDLDGFKEVNDQLGHLTGDEVLREVALALTRSLGTETSVARMGGDEFAILLPDADLPQARSLMLRAQAAVRDAMESHGWRVDFSAGAVTFVTAPRSVDEAIRLADDLAREVKQAGKGDVGHAVARLALSRSRA